MGSFSTIRDAARKLRLRMAQPIAIAVMCLPGSLWGAAHSAPSISIQPASQSVPAGQTVIFTVSATGTVPIIYQWRFNGADIAGATDTNLVVAGATSSNAGDYTVLITNGWGSLTSSIATLTVNYPAVIKVQPVSQAAVIGGTAGFSVTATGTTALGYQWCMNGQSVPGATASTLILSGVQSNRAGAYTVVVTNAGGRTTSSVATLSIVTPPDFLWARNVTNCTPDCLSQSDAGHVAADAFGNVFVAGSFQGYQGATIDFGGGSLTNSSGSSLTAPFFLAKYGRFGDFEWARLVGTNAVDRGALRVAADPSGNCYFAGRFSGTVNLGTNVLVSADPSGVFVAKFDPQGQAVWARQVAAYDPNYPWLLGFGVDAAGHAILSGRFTNAANFGGVSVTNGAAFLARYDSAGNLLWAQSSLAGDAVALGPSGSVFLSGAILPSSSRPRPGMLAEYDSLGNLLWSRPFPPSQAITVDAAENIFTTGFGLGTYGDITLTNAGGVSDYFVAKCNSAGQLLWVRQVGSVTQQSGISVAVDALGNVYVASTSANLQPDPVLVIGPTIISNAVSFAAKYDSAGDALWGKALTTTNYAAVSGMALADPQQMYVAGRFLYRASFGMFNLSAGNSPGDDLFVAKLTAVEPPAAAALSSPMIAGGQFQFTVTGSPGLKYAVQASTNLADWIFVLTNTAPFQFVEPGSSGFARRYYRCVCVP